MNTDHVVKKFSKQMGKLSLVALSSLSLFATAFTTLALAEVKEGAEQLNTSLLQEAIQTSGDYLRDITNSSFSVVVTDATQLLDASAVDISATDNPVIDTLSPSGDAQVSEVKDSVVETDFANDSEASNQTVATIASSTNEAIVVDGDTITIQGDCTTTDIYQVMHTGGAGESATELHFSGISTICTMQIVDSDAPFAHTNLKTITADKGARVFFKGKDAATAPTLNNMFNQSSNLISLDGLSSWDVSNVTGKKCMSYMFYNCSELISLDGLSAWNVSKVTGEACMEAMFRGCSNLTSLDGLSAWDVSNVTGEQCMHYMFQNCKSLTSLDGLSSWNMSRISGKYCIAYMFQNCKNLTSLDGLSAWDLSSVKGDYCMEYMFESCEKLISLDGLSPWNLSNVQGEYCMQQMFSWCTRLVSLDALAGWNIDAALASRFSVDRMFNFSSKIASITLGGPSGFKLSNDSSESKDM